MSAVGQVDAGINTGYDASRTQKTSSDNYGNTVGTPKLSDEAAKYYEQLKSRFSNMDFVLVSNDQVDGAEEKAAKFANPNRTLVLIDADKIEKMATDENYRKKYEDIIGNADNQLDQLKADIEKGARADVKTYGIKIDDGGNASFFAVVDKSLASQKERITKQAAEKKKAAAKEAKTKEAKIKQKKTQEKKDAKETQKTENGGNVETIRASSIQELVKKLNDHYYAGLSDRVLTEEEQKVGSRMDFWI